MDSLRGSVAIVTGASRGFGRDTALQLAAEGVRVVVAARSADALSALVDEIHATGGEAAWRVVDVRDPEQCSALVEWTVAEMGGLHILVNNAGLGYWASVEETTDEEWRQTMRVNLDAVFYLTRAAVGPMKRAGRGHIVNIASVMGKHSAANMAVYAASKAAVIALSEGLAREVAHSGIQVSVISPGTVDTTFRAGMVDRPPDPSRTDPERMLRPADVAAAIVSAVKSSRHVAYLEVVMHPRG